MIINILLAVLAVLVGIIIFILYKQVPIWWACRKEIQLDKEIEEEIECINNGSGTAYKIERIEQEITSLFLTLKQVKNITVLKSADGLNVTVTTILKSRHYNSCRSLYAKQLQIHDMFPDVNIDFNVIFDNKNNKDD